MANFFPSFYLEQLYPLQDKALALIVAQDTGFYLSGGTASSRGYLNHRFSDDLDLFVNDSQNFTLWASRIVQCLQQTSDWVTQVTLQEARFVRVNLLYEDFALKIEMINDVPAHTGKIQQHPILGRIDSPENILANKITALVDREDPKDFADIWGFCNYLGLSLKDAITNAESKAAGIFPVEIARILYSVTQDDWAVIKWIDAPDQDAFIRDIRSLADTLLLNP